MLWASDAPYHDPASESSLGTRSWYAKPNLLVSHEITCGRRLLAARCNRAWLGTTANNLFARLFLFLPPRPGLPNPSRSFALSALRPIPHPSLFSPSSPATSLHFVSLANFLFPPSLLPQSISLLLSLDPHHSLLNVNTIHTCAKHSLEIIVQRLRCLGFCI